MHRASVGQWARVIAAAMLSAGFLLGCGSGGSSDSTSANDSLSPTENTAVTLNWEPPTQNTDGTALTDLNGYVINYGTQSGSYPNSITLTNPGLTTYVVDNLAPGTYYFTITATATDGAESPPSPEVSATVD